MPQLLLSCRFWRTELCLKQVAACSGLMPYTCWQTEGFPPATFLSFRPFPHVWPLRISFTSYLSLVWTNKCHEFACHQLFLRVRENPLGQVMQDENPVSGRVKNSTILLTSFELLHVFLPNYSKPWHYCIKFVKNLSKTNKNQKFKKKRRLINSIYRGGWWKLSYLE